MDVEPTCVEERRTTCARTLLCVSDLILHLGLGVAIIIRYLFDSQVMNQYI